MPSPCTASSTFWRSGSGIASRAATSASLRFAHARNPGTGDNVANSLRLGSSAWRSSATCLMRKFPNEMPRRPGWQLVIE
jgi:hypothetical protein